MKTEVVDTDFEKRFEKNGLILFFLVTFLIPWVMIFGLKIAGEDLNSNLGTILMMVAFIMPAVGMIAASVVTKSGLQEIGLMPKLKGNFKWYVLAWVLPALLVIAGAAVFFLCQPQYYDRNLEGLKEIFVQQKVDVKNMKAILVMYLVKGFLVDPVMNIVQTLPGELGWRGYLLPALSRKMGNVKAVLLSSLLWGIWMIPLFAISASDVENGFTVGSVLAMILFSFFVGVILSFFSIKVGSVIPAALIFSGLQNFAGFSIWFCKEGANPYIGPTVYGILGGSVLIVAAAAALVLIWKRKV